jgi:hypothetical protein
MPPSGHKRIGRVKRGILRAFIAAGNRDLTTSELLAWTHVRALYRGPCSGRVRHYYRKDVRTGVPSCDIRLISLGFQPRCRSAVLTAYNPSLTSGPNLAAIWPCDAHILTSAADAVALTQGSPLVSWTGRGHQSGVEDYVSATGYFGGVLSLHSTGRPRPVALRPTRSQNNPTGTFR